MKPFLFFCLFSLGLLPLAAQSTEFAPLGARWIKEGSGWSSATLLNVYSVVGDTLLLGKTASVIERDLHIEDGGNATHYYNIGREYVCTQGDSVCYNVNGAWHMLYNFGAQAGDMWEIAVVGYDGTANVAHIQVDSVGTEMVDGLALRCLWVSNVPGTNYGYYHPTSKIIERIGVDDIFAPSYLVYSEEVVVDYYTPKFNCYQDAQIFYGEGDSCQYVLDVPAAVSSPQLFECRHDPATRRLSIGSAHSTAVRFYLYDLQGKPVVAHSLPPQTMLYGIDISHLPAGIYVYTFADPNGGIVQRGKVAVW